MSHDRQHLRDAATVMRTLASNNPSTPLQNVFAAVGNWLESTAQHAAYTSRNIDLEHAHKVADAILRDTTLTPPAGQQ